MLLNKRLWAVYLGGFLLAMHLASVSYLNSSLVKNFVSDKALNIFYIVGALLSIISLIAAPMLLKKYGSQLIIIFFAAFKIFAVFGLAISDTTSLVILFFIVHISIDSMLYFCLDINFEKEISRENTTGRKRGFFLTIQNTAWALSPLALVFLASQNTFNKIYILSGIFLVIFLFIATTSFKNVKESKTETQKISNIFKLIKKGGDKIGIIATQLVLNFFYAWMVIYLPLLLNKEIGFSWDKIGFLFVIMLLPFLLFELPTGYFADKKFGEREFLFVGFGIMTISTFIIPFIHSQIFWQWALILFATRIGASLVESSSESYFFKHVKEDDAGLISIFRMVRPASYVIVPLLTIPIIYYFHYSTSFIFLSLFTLSGLLFVPKVDTK